MNTIIFHQFEDFMEYMESDNHVDCHVSMKFENEIWSYTVKHRTSLRR